MASISTVAVVVAIVVAALILLLFAAKQLRRQQRIRRQRQADEDLSINLTALEIRGLPAQGPRLEFYGTPVRLVVLALAPAGRGTPIPPTDELRLAVEQIVPGLSGVLDAHQPVFRRWPEQFSTSGFAQQFFTKVPLPGDHGKGTPWCCVAGRFELGDGQLMAGLVCMADRPNSLSQVIVEHAGKWLDVLRVRNESA